MNKFIGYTIGLDCNGHEQVGKLIKIEYTRMADNSVTLRAVNGRNLSGQKGVKLITSEQFENRPTENVEEARWALGHCGWSLMSDDFAGSA